MYKIYGIMESVAVKKECESILYNRLKHCTKEIFRLLTIASIALLIIIAPLIISSTIPITFIILILLSLP